MSLFEVGAHQLLMMGTNFRIMMTRKEITLPVGHVVLVVVSYGTHAVVSSLKVNYSNEYSSPERMDGREASKKSNRTSETLHAVSTFDIGCLTPVLPVPKQIRSPPHGGPFHTRCPAAFIHSTTVVSHPVPSVLMLIQRHIGVVLIITSITRVCLLYSEKSEQAGEDQVEEIMQ
ncbi:hypothetical protein R1flu_006331 [Riccia fluitans]|uniref:Uncharacterized protein n=1 Tax=Riccia fluitans TaxID=41844 RepID=A0ABD1YZS5_9MARC